MGIQDNFWTVGNEAVTWGTKAATLTRGIENQSDDVSPAIEWRTSRGMRPGTVGTPTGRSVAVDYGGTASLTVDTLSKSHGLLFGAIAATVATTTPVGATNARLHTFTPSTTGVVRSSTIHAGRVDIAGTTHHHDYLGAMASQLSMSLAAKGNAVLKVDYGYKAIDTSAASVTPSYPTSALPYNDSHCTVTIDGTTECQRQFDFTIPTGLDMERFRICPGGREKPTLKDRVEPTGTLSIDYPDDSWHNAYLAGTELEDLVITFTGGEIEVGFDYSLTITFPLIQLTGASPKVGIDTTPEQPMPFRVLDNGTDPLWKIEYQTDDTAP